MSERYENWKELLPMLDDPIEGAVCVCLADGARFKAGDIVTLLEGYDDPECKRADGVKGMMLNSQLALLPSEEQAKVERKIVQIAPLADKEQAVVFALCDDGSAWVLHGTVNPIWAQLPPIPQDAV